MNRSKVLSETLKSCLFASVLSLGLPQVAFAQETLGEIFARLTSNEVKPAASLLSSLCYVGGAITLLSGALSLRKHAENPASEPMGKGITRLLVGAGIMGLPYLAGVLQETVFFTDRSGAVYDGFTNFQP